MRHLSAAFIAASAAVAAITLIAEPASAATRSFQEYRYFRALSIDLVGRTPTDEELTAFEADDFNIDVWIDDHLTGEAYAARVRRVYTDLLRLRQTNFGIGGRPMVMLSQQVKRKDGQWVEVFWRTLQRRKDQITDRKFCIPESIAGTPGNPLLISDDDFEKFTDPVKPWWLYRDYKSENPTQLIDPVNGFQAYGPGTSLYKPSDPLIFKQIPDPENPGQYKNGEPRTEVYVCAEEAQEAEMGTLDSMNDAPVPCGTYDAYGGASSCGCGKGLERCLAPVNQVWNGAAYTMPFKDPFGDGTAFDGGTFGAEQWFNYWLSAEPGRFIDYILTEDRDFREVLTAPYTVVNGPLAQFYRSVAPTTCCAPSIFNYLTPDPLLDPASLPAELAPPVTDTWLKVEDRGPHASGLLTMPIFLLKYSSRRARAHVLSQAFLCKDFVAENIDLKPSTEPDLTKREGCNVCHATLEPLAAYFSRVTEYGWTYLPPDKFPQENPSCKFTLKDGKKELPGGCKPFYDPEFTTESAGQLRGAYASPENVEAGPQGLAKVLIEPETFSACVAQNVSTSFLGRPLGQGDDALKSILAEAFTAGGFKMSALVRALVKSDAYRRGNNLSPDAWRNGGAP